MKSPLVGFVGPALLLLASPALAGGRVVQVSPTRDVRLVVAGFASLSERAPGLQNDTVGVATTGLENFTNECILWDAPAVEPEPQRPFLSPDRVLAWAWNRTEAPVLILDGLAQPALRAPMLP